MARPRGAVTASCGATPQDQASAVGPRKTGRGYAKRLGFVKPGGPRAVTSGRDGDPLAIRCMRLSTDPGRDETRGLGHAHAALDAGVTLSTRPTRTRSTRARRGHNERLIARALATWTGDRSRVRIATKGGLTRPDGRWVPDGRARHLAGACEASLRALGVERIHLYQLHAPDPRVPLATSVRALATLRRATGWWSASGSAT